MIPGVALHWLDLNVVQIWWQKRQYIIKGVLEPEKMPPTSRIGCNYLDKKDQLNIKTIIHTFSFKQLIKSATRITSSCKSLIDVICSNKPQNISTIKVIPADLSDHELIGCVRKLHHRKFLHGLLLVETTQIITIKNSVKIFN